MTIRSDPFFRSHKPENEKHADGLRRAHQRHWPISRSFTSHFYAPKASDWTSVKPASASGPMRGNALVFLLRLFLHRVFDAPCYCSIFHYQDFYLGNECHLSWGVRELVRTNTHSPLSRTLTRVGGRGKISFRTMSFQDKQARAMAGPAPYGQTPPRPVCRVV